MARCDCVLVDEDDEGVVVSAERCENEAIEAIRLKVLGERVVVRMCMACSWRLQGKPVPTAWPAVDDDETSLD